MLRSAIQGKVIEPNDPDYDRARAVFLGGIDGHPAAIVQAADAGDVAAVIREAQDTGLELAVRGGGHSGAGHSTTNGGIVLDMRGFKSLDVDPVTRTVWAGAGLTAAEVTAEADKHGLALGFGDTGSVGIAGITLGGGVGFLVRKHGLTIDNLLAAEIVTANGETIVASGQSHEDLFWAIRGGGGNFGVVTRLHYQLHELGDMLGGMLLLPATVQTITEFMRLADEAPEELSAIANVMPAPPMPFIPAEHHGKLVIMALMAYAGPAEQGARVLAPFRELATPLADMVSPIRYPAMFPPEDESYRPQAISKTMFVDTVDEGVAETILKYLVESDAPMRAAQLRALGGAMARIPADATAFAHRDSKFMVNVATFYVGQEDKPIRQAWVDSFWKALRQNDSGAYAGFLNDEGPERVRAAYPGSTWDRLTRVKRTYDPGNLFRRNQNIPPA